jgi:transcriptional regulator with XRE-family HTH domain
MTPEQAGLPVTRRRRTPGLRREEVADLAGISPDWYTRIELGTGAVPSTATLQAIAGALRLSSVDTAYLFELAGLAMPRSVRPPIPAAFDAVENLVMMLDVHEAAVVVMDTYATPRCWNETADAMFRWSRYPDAFSRNGIVAGLSDPYYAEFFGADFEAIARSAIGMFRRTYTTAEPTALAHRIYEFGCTNPIFRRMWDEHTVAERFTTSGPIRRFVPEAGPLSLDVVDFQPVHHPGLIMRVLSPHDDDTRGKFERLAVVGVASPFLSDDY